MGRDYREETCGGVCRKRWRVLVLWGVWEVEGEGAGRPVVESRSGLGEFRVVICGFCFLFRVPEEPPIARRLCHESGASAPT